MSRGWNTDLARHGHDAYEDCDGDALLPPHERCACPCHTTASLTPIERRLILDALPRGPHFDRVVRIFECILAARLADRDAARARARAEGTLAERERIDDALARAGIDTDASGPIRAALHPAPRETP